MLKSKPRYSIGSYSSESMCGFTSHTDKICCFYKEMSTQYLKTKAQILYQTLFDSIIYDISFKNHELDFSHIENKSEAINF